MTKEAASVRKLKKLKGQREGTGIGHTYYF